MKKCDMCGMYEGEIDLKYIELNIEVISIKTELCNECNIFKKNYILSRKNEKCYILDINDIKTKKDLKKNCYYFWKDHLYMYWKEVNKIHVFKEYFKDYDNNYIIDFGIYILWKESKKFEEKDIITKHDELFIKYFFEAKLNNLFFKKDKE